MAGLMEWLQGKKTYIIMIVGFIFNLGILAGWWEMGSQVWQLIDTVLAFFGLGTIRSGIKTEAKKVS
jgi:hypothetical protein